MRRGDSRRLAAIWSAGWDGGTGGRRERRDDAGGVVGGGLGHPDLGGRAAAERRPPGFFSEFYFFRVFFACGRLKCPHAVALAACENRDLYIRFRAYGWANRMRKSFWPAWKDLFCSSVL